jgi:DNA-directed RNA polymerase specialized sigma24 family protein
LAFLLTGDVKSAVNALEEITAEGAAHINQIRDGKRMAAWYVRRIREKAEALKLVESGSPPAELPSHVREIAARIHALPEPDRSAIALFYLNRFTAREIAHLLGIRIEEFSACLERGRAVLQDAIDGVGPYKR